MRAIWIEFSGSEVKMIRETLEILKQEKELAIDERVMRVKALENILFGQGPF